MNIKIGCCGVAGDRAEYPKEFRVVEIQSIFRGTEDIEALRTWREQAPEHFEFTLKAGQLITHDGRFRKTKEVMDAWEYTDTAAEELGASVIVFECPGTFSPNEENLNNMRDFFASIQRKGYRFVLDAGPDWSDKQLEEICCELGLVHCSDPFTRIIRAGEMRYFKLNGSGRDHERYKGIDLKRLRDFCDDGSSGEMYVIFNNKDMIDDARRFEWIVENTGRIRDLNVSFLRSLCTEIERVEEDEKVQKLSLEAERIVSLILHTDYARIDIEIEKSKLREMCRELFPGKDHLYEMVYGQRFNRLWEQFRGKEEW